MCRRWRLSGASVWVSWVTYSRYETSFDRLYRETASISPDQLHPDPGHWHSEKPVPHLMASRRVWSSIDLTVFDGCSNTPSVKPLVARTRRRTFEMASWHSPIILSISLWESPRSENQTLFSIITGQILVGMFINLVWDDNLQKVVAHS